MYVALGGIYIYEIFVLIYYANEIALASDQLLSHIYESNWTCMSMKYRKIMIIIVEKWKKPQQVQKRLKTNYKILINLSLT